MAEEWLAVAAPGVTLAHLARRDMPVLSELMHELICQLYEESWPRGYAAEVLNALAGRFPWARSALGGPWRVITLWERLEP
eukprot:2951701-Lingulodinium_polyedra.AAC.1